MNRSILLFSSCLTLAGLGVAPGAFAQTVGATVMKNGAELDIRSAGREQFDEATANGAFAGAAETAMPSSAFSAQAARSSAFSSSSNSNKGKKKGNTQVNDPTLQNIQVFPGFRPFVEYTQAETTVAAKGRNIVAGFNNSSDQPLAIGPGGLAFTARRFSAYSTSNDGGKTWAAGSMPAVAGSVFTFGDPSLGVDRRGNFFYATLGADAAGVSTIQVNSSTDGGRTWSNAVVVQQDGGGDKEWLAVGKDPTAPFRDNVYVSWTHFAVAGAPNIELRFGRSIDGGATWQTQTLFTPTADPNPVNPQNALQFSNPIVDSKNGDLYIPFVQFSNADQDFIRMLKSTDGGQTFAFVNFNIAGAPDPTLLPVTQPGTLIDCGSGGQRLSIHQGAALPGRFGLPQYSQASRLVLQPSIAANGGKIYIAWNNSTSSVFGDPASNSNILLIRSMDGGATWSTPSQVNPSTANNTRHVLPSLAMGGEDDDEDFIAVAYYTQHTDGTVDTDLAVSTNDGASFPTNKVKRLTSQPTDLAPTNVPLSAAPGNTTNYDRTVRQCFNLGEYIQAYADDEDVHVVWADSRNMVTHPVNALDPLSGVTHPQQDVFYKGLEIDD